MRSQRYWLAGISLAAVGGFAAMANAQGKVTGPVATYVMTASTDGGFNTANRGAMMQAMMNGGKSNASRTLSLYLGSTRQAADAEAAHMPPAALDVGDRLPLIGPKKAPSAKDEVEHDFNFSGGKLAVYWGCGETAGAGQPVAVDLGKMPTKNMPASLSGLAFKPAVRPSASTARSYGTWPNNQAKKGVTSDSSLVGEHVVRGNYTPDIRFTLNEDQDFLAPLNVTRNSRASSGAVQLAWQPVPNARAYFGYVIGQARDGTTVMWTSSNVKTLLGSAGDFLDAAEINRLLAQKALMSPQQTQCAVPAEVANALSEGGMMMLTAYGPEANFSYPPKPAGNAPWNIEWKAKLLTKASHSGMLGMSMSEMMGGSDEEEEEAEYEEAEDEPKKKKKGFGGLLKKVL